MAELSKTVTYKSEDIKRGVISNCLEAVATALREKGYDPVNQIAGYLISNDPAYISSNRNARTIIQQIERDEIIEELVKFYLENYEE